MNKIREWSPAWLGIVAAFAASAASGQILTSSCLDSSVALSVEEARLPNTLPDNSNPAIPQSESFAQQMIEGAGFQDFTPGLVNQLCTTPKLSVAQNLVLRRGIQLWHMAVDRAQQKGPLFGNLPYSDDRPLYWTRLQARAALRQWVPQFALSDADRADLITTFDKASRGMLDINFPAGKGVKRLIFSGFDPYTLDGGTRGTAAGTVGNNIRHGNPSGATVLATAGTTYKDKNGTNWFIEAYVLPVNYPEFEAGYLEDTVGPWMLAGPRQVNASVTVSQAGPDQFNLEQWNGRYHGVSLGNDNFAPCPSVRNPTPPPTNISQLAINNHECNIMVVDRWGGPATFDLLNPPQWTTTTLPVEKMIAANTGVGIPRPPGDLWGAPTNPSASDPNAFGVVWHTVFTEFPDCSVATTMSKNSVPSYTPTPLPLPPIGSTGSPPTSWPAVPPDSGSCAQSGGGGNYLSNESAYRNTLLRDRMGLQIPAGHIHTPSMQHFETNFLVSDPTFDAWRLAIVHQGQNLVHVVADNAP